MDVISIVVGLIFGAAVGALVGWVLADRKCRRVLSKCETELAVAVERNEALTLRLTQENQASDKLRQDILATERDAANADEFLAWIDSVIERATTTVARS